MRWEVTRGNTVEMARTDTPCSVNNAKRRRRLRGGKWCLGFGLVLLLMQIAMYPWAFFLGGHFHPLGLWRGWGRMHSRTAGDYFLYVEIHPTSYGHTMYPAWDLAGTARLCTPKREYFVLRLNGGMPQVLCQIARAIDSSRDGQLAGNDAYRTGHAPGFHPMGNLGRRRSACR